jgi:deaminated glutathione amidase
MVSGASVPLNLKHALESIAVGAEQGCELIALPEYFCFLGAHDEDKLAVAEEYGQGLLQDALRKIALKHRVWLVAGTLPLKSEHLDRVFNACLVFGPNGELVTRYDKMHLFTFDNGVERYDESRVLLAGQTPVAFDLPSRDGHCWRVGLSVCYDMRFPELYRQMHADILLIPSAFTYTTGQAHWETLLRARAIENLAYVVAPAQGGVHENGRRTWGHSMIVDPWGRILAQHAVGEAVICTDFDHALIQESRTRLPALSHRLM